MVSIDCIVDINISLTFFWYVGQHNVERWILGHNTHKTKKKYDYTVFTTHYQVKKYIRVNITLVTMFELTPRPVSEAVCLLAYMWLNSSKKELNTTNLLQHAKKK